MEMRNFRWVSLLVLLVLPVLPALQTTEVDDLVARSGHQFQLDSPIRTIESIFKKHQEEKPILPKCNGRNKEDDKCKSQEKHATKDANLGDDSSTSGFDAGQSIKNNKRDHESLFKNEVIQVTSHHGQEENTSFLKLERGLNEIYQEKKTAFIKKRGREKSRKRQKRLLGLQPVQANTNVALTIFTRPQSALNILMNRFTAVMKESLSNIFKEYHGYLNKFI